MFHNENNGTFWIAKDLFPVPVQMTVYIDSSYDSPNANAKAPLKHHSSGFAFWTGGGSYREVNYGFTRNDFKAERLLTSENAELIGINRILKYVASLPEQPENLTLICDNMSLVKKLNDIREVTKILGRFPASEVPKTIHQAEYDTYLYLMKLFPNLVFQHIKGHADSEFNHLADRMAHLGKKIQPGQNYPEHLIFRALTTDSAEWYSQAEQEPPNAVFHLGVSKEPLEIRGGVYRHGYCLYDSLHEVSHSGSFETLGHGKQEYLAMGAIQALRSISHLFSKLPSVEIITSDLFTVNMLHAYAFNYVIPSTVIHKNTAMALIDHKKAIKKYGHLCFKHAEDSTSLAKDSKEPLRKAQLGAEEALSEYSLYRSFYA